MAPEARELTRGRYPEKAEDFELLGVLDIGEVKSVGRRGHAALRAVARFEHLFRPTGFALTGADAHQHTGDVAHHVLQEGVGVDADTHELAVTLDFKASEFAHRALGLAFGGTEGREVVRTDKMLRALLHRRRIERPVLPAHTPAQVGRAYRAVEDHVVVAPPGGGKARVKIRVHLARPQQRHVIRQIADRPAHPGVAIARSRGIEMNHLRQCVHAGVGAPGDGNGDGFVGDFGERLLDTRLHRGAPGPGAASRKSSSRRIRGWRRCA